MRKEITETCEAAEASGFAREPLMCYHRGHGVREWERYVITAPRCTILLSVEDYSGSGLYTIALLSPEKKWNSLTVCRRRRPKVEVGLPEDCGDGTAAVSDRGIGLLFRRTGGRHMLVAHADASKNGPAVDLSLMLQGGPEESSNLVTPGKKEGTFTLLHRQPGLTAQGTVELGGEKLVLTGAPAAFGWGRETDPARVTRRWLWAWGEAEGKPFGFTFDGVPGTEQEGETANVLFYDGRLQRLDSVSALVGFDGTPEADYSAPWTVVGSGKRLHAVFQPEQAEALACGEELQVVTGTFKGTAVLEDGTEVHFEGLRGYLETWAPAG